MREAPAAEAGTLGIYLHFPFCAARCSYCDFATVAGRDRLIGSYLTALEAEIRLLAPSPTRAADTVYIGGGTPSRMQPAQLRRLLDAVRERFELTPGAEITLEGNPESLVAADLGAYRELGVNRVCVGVQSLDDRVLARVGRPHDARCAAEAVARVRAAAFRSIGIDLIAGLPGEDLRTWVRSLEKAIALGPDHVSVYLLETDKDTPLARSVREGGVELADDDALAWAYETTVAALEGAGLAAYEISNFARPGHRSRHNLKYWTDAPYAAFGLGAHGYLDGERRANVRDLDTYLARLGAAVDPVDTVEAYDRRRRAGEALVMGLRLAEGLDVRQVGSRYGIDLESVHGEAWERAEAAGLVERRDGRARLTAWGRLRCNELFAELL